MKGDPEFAGESSFLSDNDGKGESPWTRSISTGWRKRKLAESPGAASAISGVTAEVVERFTFEAVRADVPEVAPESTSTARVRGGLLNSANGGGCLEGS